MDNSGRPVIHKVSVLGVRTSLIDTGELTREVIHRAVDGPKSLILNVNVQCLNLTFKHPWLKDFLNEAPIVFCDGAGVQLGA